MSTCSTTASSHTYARAGLERTLGVAAPRDSPPPAPRARALTTARAALPCRAPRHNARARAQVWRSGQDQAKALKKELEGLLPGLRVFLDVDSLTHLGQLEATVRASAAVVLFLSEGFFSSGNCLREVRAALEAALPIAVVHETSALHGAVSVAQLRAACRACGDELVAAAAEQLFPEPTPEPARPAGPARRPSALGHHRRTSEAALPLPPVGSEAKGASALGRVWAGEPIPWRRERAYLDATLVAIAEVLRAAGSLDPPPARPVAAPSAHGVAGRARAHTLQLGTGAARMGEGARVVSASAARLDALRSLVHGLLSEHLLLRATAREAGAALGSAARADKGAARSAAAARAVVPLSSTHLAECTPAGARAPASAAPAPSALLLLLQADTFGYGCALDTAAQLRTLLSALDSSTAAAAESLAHMRANARRAVRHGGAAGTAAAAATGGVRQQDDAATDAAWPELRGLESRALVRVHVLADKRALSLPVATPIPLAHIARDLELDLLQLPRAPAHVVGSAHGGRPSVIGRRVTRASLVGKPFGGRAQRLLVTWPRSPELVPALIAAVSAAAGTGADAEAAREPPAHAAPDSHAVPIVSALLDEPDLPLSAEFRHVLMSAPAEVRAARVADAVFGALAVPLREGVHEEVSMQDLGSQLRRALDVPRHIAGLIDFGHEAPSHRRRLRGLHAPGAGHGSRSSALF